MKSILIATDQPFWRRENGAQQRTWSIVQFLLRNGFELNVFFLVPMTQSDVDTCHEHGLSMVLFDPRAIGPRDRIAFGIGRLINGVKACFGREARADPVDSLTLESYRWPLAAVQFRSTVDRLRPEFVFSVYVIWAHLLDAFPNRQRCFRAIVDTHDLLHQRQQEFTHHGQPHWITVCKDEEAAALQKFDLILASQAEEAETLRVMAPRSDVIVVGHLPENVAESVRTDWAAQREHGRLRFGYLASDNPANVDGILWFLNQCWDEVHRLTGAELVIAGNVEEGLRRQMAIDRRGVRCLGKVSCLEDFYAEMDIAINPVRFGSGIKIKSIEAIGYGKPLVAHSHNTRGLSSGVVGAMIVADVPDQFIAACVRLIQDEVWRNEVVERCHRVRETELSLGAVYSGFLEWLGVDESH